MTREQMLSYMENPALLTEKTLGELREILDEFPYFQTAHLLYTRNLLSENNFRFTNQLKVCAVHATDRTVLYHLLFPEQKSRKGENLLGINIPIDIKEGVSGLEMSENVPDEYRSLQPENSTETIEPGKINHNMLNFKPGESVYRLEGEEIEPGKTLAQLVKEINEGAGITKDLKSTDLRGDLIDRFIKENPSLSNRGLSLPENSYSNVDQDDTVTENDEFITETLARIYIKQGLYQKAINAFQRLTLKYPEKSVYFARQIEEVTNLINK
jgi:hypothetical protein